MKAIKKNKLVVKVTDSGHACFEANTCLYDGITLYVSCIFDSEKERDTAEKEILFPNGFNPNGHKKSYFVEHSELDKNPTRYGSYSKTIEKNDGFEIIKAFGDNQEALRPHFMHCAWCGNKFSDMNKESPMLENELWAEMLKKIGYGTIDVPFGTYCCKDCIERYLGRRIERRDLHYNALINEIFWAAYNGLPIPDIDELFEIKRKKALKEVTNEGEDQKDQA